MPAYTPEHSKTASDKQTQGRYIPEGHHPLHKAIEAVREVMERGGTEEDINKALENAGLDEWERSECIRIARLRMRVRRGLREAVIVAKDLLKKQKEDKVRDLLAVNYSRKDVETIMHAAKKP
jgi:hypothetical protein